MNLLKKLTRTIEKEWAKPPKVRVFAPDPRDEKKAELMQKIFEHQWAENWPYVRADLQSRIKMMIQKCFLFGQHDWMGCGEKGKHVCKRCGLKAGIAYDPIFDGLAHISWDKNTKPL